MSWLNPLVDLYRGLTRGVAAGFAHAGSRWLETGVGHLHDRNLRRSRGPRVLGSRSDLYSLFVDYPISKA